MRPIASPYADKEVSEWKAITQALVAQHPLKLDELLEVTLQAWELVWDTRIGSGETAIRLEDIDVPATVVGYFLEKLIAKELERRYPNAWRGGLAKTEKDLVYIIEPDYSIEVKTSGQLGTKIFGNRSYSKGAGEGEAASKPEKSGYYLAVNFHEKTLLLVRFGWIDWSDWAGQKAQSGQAASLGSAVYEHKLVIMPGDYMNHQPVQLLPGVGPKRAESLFKLGVSTVGDIKAYGGDDPSAIALRKSLFPTPTQTSSE